MTSSVGFYVYVHINAQTSEVFYVGKGRADRYKTYAHRSAHWVNYVKKYGFEARIVADGMSEDAAFRAEIAVIDLLRSQGVKLINKGIGGEGNQGAKPINQVSVTNSDGETFLSMQDAADRMVQIGWTNACAANISKAANHRAGIIAYGRTWWRTGLPPKPLRLSNTRARTVMSSMGEKFSSCAEAADYLKRNEWSKALPQAISAAARGAAASIYGRSWWWEGDDPKEYIPPNKRLSAALMGRKKSVRSAPAVDEAKA